jgi:hypothetical protein
MTAGKPAKLSELLGNLVASGVPAADLQGAIVFVRLERALDNLIRHALALGPYHPGRPSPWSHVFLLAEAYSGPATPIVDCTVRTKANRIIWDQDHDIDPIKILWHKDVKSGVCSGALDDYDDPRVPGWGVKWLQDLAPAERAALTAEATNPRWAPYHYDFPGLLRELLRLSSRGAIDPPPGKNLLFCSAFVQAVYSRVLGPKGDFAVRTRDDDTTPDDLWYSALGSAYPDLTAGGSDA